MSEPESKPSLDKRAKYRIKVVGIVRDTWADYFSGMTIQVNRDDEQESETTLVGWLSDQASLLGVLSLLLDWGHSILKVEYIAEN